MGDTESETKANSMTVTDASGSFIRVLGPLEVVSEDGLAQLGGPKQRAVLAMLTARAGRVVTTDELVDGIWGDEPPAAVSSSLHSYISTLRTVIDRRSKDTDPATCSMLTVCGSTPTSLKTLWSMVAGSWSRARPSQQTSCARRWQCGGVVPMQMSPISPAWRTRRADSPICGCPRSKYGSMPTSRLGRHAAVVGELDALAAENPFRESLRAKHMLALYRDGRQADALRAYQRTQELPARRARRRPIS